VLLDLPSSECSVFRNRIAGIEQESENTKTDSFAAFRKKKEGCLGTSDGVAVDNFDALMKELAS